MNFSDRLNFASLSACPALGALSLHLCANFFESGEHVWRASYDELRCAGLDEKKSRAFLDFRRDFDHVALRNILERESIRVVMIDDDAYPVLLREIYDPPFVLFVRGTLSSPIKNPLAVVGSRKMSPYGAQIIERVITPAAQAGCSVISGLALGVDGAAHSAALDAGTYTVAVLGTGVDDRTIYPKQHFHLSQRILADGGAIISEFAPGTPGLKHHFPLRNRIISGMSQVVCVVEAAKKSGSLITARSALDQNRTVCTFPGSIFSPGSSGCNELIASGARPVLSANDILDEFGVSHEEFAKTYTPENEQESVLLSLLSDVPIHIDDMISQSKLSASSAMTTLTMLEAKRIVKQISGGNYVKSV